MVSEWVTRNRFDPGYLPTIEGKLYFEGEGKTRSMTNYIVLLTLATVIATYGVISGSTATVIGAMIIAPLMTPIMAITLAMVLGEGNRITRSLLVVGLSVLYVVGLAILLSSFVSPLVIGFNTNPEITSRVSPNLLALLVALASGAAGAFAVSREDVGDTLPGVAIAISLVPPLATVGIALSKAEWVDAGGASLLFLTNFLAIVIAGGVVFFLSGVTVRRTSSTVALHRSRTFQVALVATIIVAVVLGLNGYRTVEQDRDSLIAEGVVTTWLEGTNYSVSSITMKYQTGDLLIGGPASSRITIAGSGEMPSLGQLALSMQEALGYPVTFELRVLPQQVDYFPRNRTPPFG
ncbi:MAG: DUF389 domain-containing protein [Methanoregulaceae archaeon]|nr:DUF389 domain-containing protein [Methanoregulaceae archaeon]